MIKSDNKGAFWPSYVDIMTTLFAITLVLFAVCFVRFKIKEDQLRVLAQKYEEIVSIYSAVENIDPNYFKYDEEYSKFIFNIDVQFETGYSDLESGLEFDKQGNTQAAENVRIDVLKAGNKIKETISLLQKNDSIKQDIKYLVVLEGQASDDGYRDNDVLSYNRALGLHNFWKKHGIDFTNMKKCELVICGSGIGGVPRIKARNNLNYQERMEIERKNQRFLIHIVPVIGKISIEHNQILETIKK